MQGMFYHMRGDGLHAYLMLCILMLDPPKYLLHLDEGIRHDFLSLLELITSAPIVLLFNFLPTAT